MGFLNSPVHPTDDLLLDHYVAVELYNSHLVDFFFCVLLGTWTLRLFFKQPIKRFGVSVEKCYVFQVSRSQAYSKCSSIITLFPQKRANRPIRCRNLCGNCVLTTVIQRQERLGICSFMFCNVSCNAILEPVTLLDTCLSLYPYTQTLTALYQYFNGLGESGCTMLEPCLARRTACSLFMSTAMIKRSHSNIACLSSFMRL